MARELDRRSPPGEPHQAPAIDFDDYARLLDERSTEELRLTYFVLWTIHSGWRMRIGRALARLGLTLHVPGTEAAIERTVFRQFCGGTSLDEAMERTGELHRHGIGSILDYAVEAEEDEDQLDAVASEISRVIDVTAVRPEIRFVAVKLSGLARTELLESASKPEQLTNLEQEELARAEARVDELAARSASAGIGLFVDAEHSWIQPAIDEIAERLMARHNREHAVVHTTVQLYLTGGIDRLRHAIERARGGGYRLGVKLVRGAYMEQERERARERGYPSPVQPTKADTDRAFDDAVTLALENLDAVTVCVASHNVASVRHLLAEMARLGISRGDPRVSSSQLLGMFDRITYPLAEHGYQVLKYVPYGRVREAFPYLLRRADENKSVADQLSGELAAVRAELRRRKRGTL